MISTRKILARLFKTAWASFYESRNGPHWRAVRKVAIIRDGGKCKVCGSRHRLHVHHINGWAWFPLERFALDNLDTLCSECHYEYHDWNGGTRVKCTLASYKKWLKSKRRRRKKKKPKRWPLYLALLIVIVIAHQLISAINS